MMDFFLTVIVVICLILLGLLGFSGIYHNGTEKGYEQCQKEKTVSTKPKSDEFPKHFTVNGVHCIALNDKAISCDWNNTTQKQGENYE